jgi:3-oxoacyl-[acyl-carrier protein] reductase
MTGRSTISRGEGDAENAERTNRLDLALSDKVAVVTGSSRGLGLAVADALVREGCRVAICARGAARLNEAAAELRKAAGDVHDRVLPIEADLSTVAGVERVISETVAVFGGLDILVNNVGLARGAGIADTSDAEWTEALDQTLFPAIRASRLAVPQLRRRGGGAIVMIGSIWGRESGGRMTYNAVKAAEISLAKSMAQQLARDNIRVNSVAPGSISFPGGTWHRRQQEDPAGMAEFVRRELPFGRFGRPEEVGAVVAFLVSPRASWISGASVPVDGCQSRSQI